MRFPTPILDGRRLLVPLGGPHRTLSWAVNGGGLRRASTVIWRYVREGELGPSVDPAALIGDDAAVGLLTARDLSTFESTERESGEQAVRALATVGLGNALAAGDSPGPLRPGTINLLVQLSQPLDDGALVEALSLAAEARTAAILEARIPSRRSRRWATGTGTDCIVVAAPDDGRAAERWVGKHTLTGSLIGAAVEEVIARGAAAWLAEQRLSGSGA
jgi:adenosylcobinamide amidohydrolase